MVVSSILPIKAEKCCILFVHFDRREKILFIEDLVEIVVILPDPAPFCISGNIPVDFNYSRLKNSMSGGKYKEKSVWKPPDVVHIFDQKRDNLWDLKPIGMIIFGLSFSKTEGKYKTSTFCFLPLLYKQKDLGKSSVNIKIVVNFFLI